MPVYIIHGRGRLRRSLQRPELSRTDTTCVLLDGDEECRNVLSSRGLSEISTMRLSNDAREEFLREYLDLIGEIGRQCGDRSWWASDMASKNRETSRLPVLLHEFRCIIESINKAGDRNLLIVNPSWVLLDSLKEYLTKKRMKYRVLCGQVTQVKERISIKLRTLARILHVFMKVGVRKIYFSCKLRNRLRELSRELSLIHI